MVEAVAIMSADAGVECGREFCDVGVILKVGQEGFALVEDFDHGINERIWGT